MQAFIKGIVDLLFQLAVFFIAGHLVLIALVLVAFLPLDIVIAFKAERPSFLVAVVDPELLPDFPIGKDFLVLYFQIRFDLFQVLAAGSVKLIRFSDQYFFKQVVCGFYIFQRGFYIGFSVLVCFKFSLVLVIKSDCLNELQVMVVCSSGLKYFLWDFKQFSIRVYYFYWLQ